MSSASWGRCWLNSSTKSSNLACCWRMLAPAGRVASCLRVRCMRSWRPFCWGWPGLMRSMEMPRRNHQTESLERLNRPLGEAKGTPVVRANGARQAALSEEALKGRKGGLFRIGFHGLTQQQITGGMIGDGERVAVAFVPQHELALVVGTPQLVRLQALC